MGTHIGIGFSQKTDTPAAVREASIASRVQLDKDDVHLALVLSTIHYDPKETVPILESIFYDAKLLGCSTAGIILSGSIQTRGIAVLTIHSDDIRFGTGCVDHLDTLDIHQAGNLLAKETLADFGSFSRQAFLYFVDGNMKQNAYFLKGIQEIFGNVFPVLGAGSCDNFRFSKSFQIYRDRPLTNAAAGLIIGGHAHVGIGCGHGWRPLGKPRIVDESQDNVIKSISGKSAASLYQEYFKEDAENLWKNPYGQMSILYPLGIYVKGSQEYLLRNTVNILEDGSIVCQGDVPAGSEIHIMIGNKDSCKQAAFQAAEEAQRNLLGKEPKFIIVLESMARLKLLGRRAIEEINKVTDVFGTEVPLIGMYANGEISPFQTIEKFKMPYLLNESIVVLAVG